MNIKTLLILYIFTEQLSRYFMKLTILYALRSKTTALHWTIYRFLSFLTSIINKWFNIGLIWLLLYLFLFRLSSWLFFICFLVNLLCHEHWLFGFGIRLLNNLLFLLLSINKEVLMIKRKIDLILLAILYQIKHSFSYGNHLVLF